RKKGSNRRPTAVALLQKVHARIWRLRNEYQHRQSFKLVRDLGTMVIEDLNIKGRSAGMLSKSVHDAGWASFIAKVTYKAENAGRQLIAVNPAGTSQTCICGASVRKALSDREHVCIECGLIAPRVAGRSLFQENLARTEFAAIAQRSFGEASSVASRSRTPQHLGNCLARRLLEVCGAPETRGRQARFLPVRRQQFLCASGERGCDRIGMAPGSSTPRYRAPRTREGPSTGV